MPSCKAVSYTHLDVYKRQHFISTVRYVIAYKYLEYLPTFEYLFFVHKFNVKFIILIHTNKATSVSYTHLDVYKRQVYMPLMLSVRLV